MPSARTHVGGVGLSRRATKASIALLLAMLALIFFFLYVALTAQAAQAQTSVPRTAREAARMPQFAAKLRAGAAQNGLGIGHSYHLQGGYRNPLRSRQGGSLPTDDVVYTNGPINGTTDAWAINFGFIVSDTFTVPSGGANLTALTFGAWLFPGDVLQSVEVSITDSEFGGTTYFDGVVNFAQSDCVGNQYGFNICIETGNFTLNSLANGTYWVNLQSASVNTGDPVYWDENSGPSLASENSVGTIPSEAFTLLGSATTTCPYCPPPPECVHDKPADGFQTIHDFTAEEQSPASGVAIDPAGNLYGATGAGGINGDGLAYRLAPSGQSWLFSPLYSFQGGFAGYDPRSEVIGPDGALYGTARGGIVNCGSLGNLNCGIVYRLRPAASICLTALCNWSSQVIYRFTGNSDGWDPSGSLTFDHAGNLYGLTNTGGLYGHGTVYELTPSGGQWTKRVLYSFTGGSDGGGPSSLLLGEDGNLYGTTLDGGAGGGVLFRLMPSGGNWTEAVIASYGPCHKHTCLPTLIQQQSGNLYAVDSYYTCPPITWCSWFGRILAFFQASDGTWVSGVLDDEAAHQFFGVNADVALFTGLALNSAGQLYGITHAEFFEVGGTQYFDYVFELQAPYEQRLLVYFGGGDLRDLHSGSNGRLYGTTGRCGFSFGSVWELSPH